jgi:predicted small secreted protein
MQRTIGYAAALLLVCLLAACATAEVSGRRVSTATSAVRLSSVDVVFLDRPSLKRTDLGGNFASPSSYTGLSDRVASDVRRAMSEARDGVQTAFASHGIQGRAYLASSLYGTPEKPTSHKVVVSLISAQANAQSTASITLQVAVFETATNQLLWQGESKTFPGGDGFSNKAREDAILKKQQNFGEGIVRALREAGLLVGRSQGDSN